MRDWQYYIIYLGTFYGIFLGYTSVKISYKKRQTKELRFVKYGMYFSYFFFIFTIPAAIRVNFGHIQLNVKNPLIAYAVALTICMRLIFFLLVIGMKEKRDRELVTWLHKLWSIQTSYFDRFVSIPADTSLRKFLIVDILLMFMHCMTLMINLWEMYALGRIWKFFDMYLLCIIINFQHHILWHHEVLLCLLHECFSKLNYQLQHFVMDPKLSLIYYQLAELVANLNNIFCPLLLWLQMCLIVTNSVVGYVLILYFCSSNVDLEAFAYILGGRMYILLGVRKYLYFRFCHQVTNTTRKTADILREFNIKDLEAEIELISLNLWLSKVIITIRGVFNIDLNSFFSIIARTVLLIIVLVQVDLQNKRHASNHLQIN